MRNALVLKLRLVYPGCRFHFASTQTFALLDELYRSNRTDLSQFGQRLKSLESLVQELFLPCRAHCLFSSGYTPAHALSVDPIVHRFGFTLGLQSNKFFAASLKGVLVCLSFRCVVTFSVHMKKPPKPKTTRRRPSSTAGHLVSGFRNLDIGSPELAGSAKQVEGGWDLVAGGVDIWEKSDQFHFVLKQVSGDFDIAVRVASFTPAHLYSKAGLMIRETLNTDSPHLMFLVFCDNSPRNNNLGAYEMQFRSIPGGNCQAIYPVVRPPAPPEFPAAYPDSWLRVERRGNRFWAFASTDGKNWKLYAIHELKLARQIYLGPALTSHNPQITAKACFRDYREI